ncbi:4-(cytidine 5'-diphospho)-2-C-methyl-D-erythritol kinase [Pseudooceanicola sp. MF1-13]|uniref:4-(cytidine 5'-diphospho)-2-C-methyl-D-erythritol kinase n=1 Tax=Pseudooceanicola sp. MF1-13 TaxID=3379095 RepID=UPI0038924DD3
MTADHVQKDRVEEFAPAKINLTLHVTGQRSDGYHLLDSLVVFADVGDRLTIRTAPQASMTVTGPLADGVPDDARNLVMKALAFADTTAHVDLEKHLPAAAGIGGGSSDAAATLRGVAKLTGRGTPSDAYRLGADIPVCLIASVARMQGIGEIVTPLPPLPPLHAVLVNPRVDVPTPQVFKAMTKRDNPPMPALQDWPDTASLIDWLKTTRNDMEPAACAIAPVITDVLTRLSKDPACLLARMSGSGATCFALTDTRDKAEAMASRLADTSWWVQPVTLR